MKRSLKLVMKALEDFAVVSGQKVNCNKSCFMSHTNLHQRRRCIIEQIIEFQHKRLLVKYLGCLLYFGRQKKFYFSGICELVTSWILSWKGRLLSHGGKLVLIKSVLVSMHSLIFAASNPPKAMFSTLEKMFEGFLWDSEDFGPRLHQISQEQLCQPYEEGGVGMRALQHVFEAFLLKL